MKKDKDWLSEQVGELDSTDAVFNESGLPYIDTVVSIERVFDLIYQLDEPEVLSQKLPVIPKYVADWIEDLKSKGINLLEGIYDFTHGEDIYDYIREQGDVLMRAWLDGFTVGKEQKYYVYLGDGQYLVSEDDLKEPHAKIRHQEDRGFLNYNTTFTKQEIKDYDERYWPFAVPVEEVQND